MSQMSESVRNRIVAAYYVDSNGDFVAREDVTQNMLAERDMGTVVEYGVCTLSCPPGYQLCYIYGRPACCPV